MSAARKPRVEEETIHVRDIESLPLVSPGQFLEVRRGRLVLRLADEVAYAQTEDGPDYVLTRRWVHGVLLPEAFDFYPVRGQGSN